MRRLSRSRPWVVATASVLVAAILLGGGWFLAVAFRSPEQQSAAVGVPAAGPVYAKVAKGELADQLSFSGLITPRTKVDLPIGSGTDASVITQTKIAVGATVNSGDAVIEVNGRPIIASLSPFPFYRDMVLGDSGPDVMQLQQSLVGLRLLGSADGKFGAKTATALRKLYTALGYAVPTKATEAVEPTSGTTPDQPGPTAPAPPAESPYAPVREFLGIPTLPATVLSMPAVGEDTASLRSPLTVGSAELVASFEVNPTIGSAVSPGATFTVDLGNGVQATASVTAVTPVTSTPDDGASAVSQESTSSLIIATVDKEVSAGATVIGLLTTNLIAADALIVPTSAVVGRGSEGFHVLRKADDGSTEEVRVEELGSVRGRSAISLVEPDSLDENDLVLVG